MVSSYTRVLYDQLCKASNDSIYGTAVHWNSYFVISVSVLSRVVVTAIIINPKFAYILCRQVFAHMEDGRPVGVKGVKISEDVERIRR